MMVNARIYKISFVTLVCFLPSLTGEYVRYQRSHFSCDAEVNMQSAKGEVARVIMNYRFDRGEGSYNATGTYAYNGNVISLNNHFTFDYYIEPGRLVLISREDNSNPALSGQGSLMFPDFFIYSERGISMHVSKVNNAGYFLRIGDTPMLYCKRPNI